MLRPAAPPPPAAIYALPSAVLNAERLIGSLVPCGPGIRPVGWPDGPRARANALRSQLSSAGLVAVLETAAWVWGSDWAHSQQIEASTMNRQRFLGSLNGRTVREFNIQVTEVRVFDGVRVTTPLRTVLDLITHADALEHRLVTRCRFLCEAYGIDQEPLQEALSNPRLPFRVRALGRLSRVFEAL